MSWIDVVDEDEADDRLAEVYEQIAGARGKVSNIMRVHSLKPEAMDTHMELYKAVMFGKSGLSREEREVVATAVSVANGCPYCVHHHAEALRAYWRDDDRVDAFATEPRTFDGLDERQRALVDYALAVTDDPGDVDESTIDTLRDQGFDDEEILCVNLVASYFNFVNRIALGLGVGFDDDEVKGYEY